MPVIFAVIMVRITKYFATLMAVVNEEKAQYFAKKRYPVI